MNDYCIGSTVLFGGYEWRILDIRDNTALIITEDMIEQQPYHNRAGDVTWADCALRNYLNHDFYDQFTSDEKARVVTVLNQNQDNNWYSSKGGEDTWDHVFLLSLEETVCKYFGDSSSNLENRSAKQRYWFQKKDINNTNRRAKFKDSGWWWWLRTPGRDNKRAVYIHGDGNIGIQGNKTFRYSSTTLHKSTGSNCGGVRPALWLKL